MEWAQLEICDKRTTASGLPDSEAQSASSANSNQGSASRGIPDPEPTGEGSKKKRKLVIKQMIKVKLSDVKDVFAPTATFLAAKYKGMQALEEEIKKYNDWVNQS